jgi:hypothetical protein
LRAACLHDADATDVSYLAGDARTIDVCFAPTSCFTIDRRHGAIARRPPAALEMRATAQPRHTQPLSFAWVSKEVGRVCAGATCKDIRDAHADELAGGRADVDTDYGAMLVTVGGDGTTPARVFLVSSGGVLTDMKIVVVAPCAEATWLDDEILVSSDDCNGGSPNGVLYNTNGRSRLQVGLGRALDTHDATSAHQDKTLAILAPRAYALVLADSPTRQSVIDLVPIQADATPAPRFDVAPLGVGDWAVASATGGVGVIDHRTSSLEKTWIIPRCEATGP